MRLNYWKHLGSQRSIRLQETMRWWGFWWCSCCCCG